MMLADAPQVDVSWLTVAVNCLGYLIGVPYVVIGMWRTLCEWLSRKAPWREGRLFPFIPFRFGRDERVAEYRARVAEAVSQSVGAPLSVPYVKVRSAAVSAHSSSLALEALVPVLIMAVGLGTTVLVAKYWPDFSLGKVPITADAAYSVSKVIGCLVAGIGSVRVTGTYSRKWVMRNSDVDAVWACLGALQACHYYAAGNADGRVVEHAVARLCSELQYFAVVGGGFADPHKQRAFARHVMQVRKELFDSTDRIFIDGVTANSGVVERLAIIASRMCEQRWLRLMDVVDADVVASSAAETRGDRRDTWIVLGGSLAAAIGLGAAAAAGVPLMAAVPAALVLILGPATLWGSSRLNMSPSGLLRSMSGSLSNSAQAEAAAGSPASGERSARPDQPEGPTGVHPEP